MSANIIIMLDRISRRIKEFLGVKSSIQVPSAPSYMHHKKRNIINFHSIFLTRINKREEYRNSFLRNNKIRTITPFKITC